MKTCSGCKAALPHSAFYPRSAARDGLRARCRTCQADAARASRQANPEQAKARDAAQHISHRAARNASSQAYNAAHKAALNAKSRAYYHAHKLESAAYSAAHKPENAAKSRAYYHAHKLESAAT